MRRPANELRIIPVLLPDEIQPGDSLPEKLIRALRHQKTRLVSGDILIVKHKIVSKSEGQLVDLSAIRPSRNSQAWGRRYAVDPRVTELATAQGKRIVRRKKGVLITETHHGFICANSGIDVSNVNGGKHALLLPKDPDRSAANLHRSLKRLVGVPVPVIITDSFGRPWREGLTEVAIGVAGMNALHDFRGSYDSHGYKLRASMEAVADELACAAGLVCGKLARTPFCVIRGFRYQSARGGARALIRPANRDLFR